jgi:hypothetical protein
LKALNELAKPQLTSVPNDRDLKPALSVALKNSDVGAPAETTGSRLSDPSPKPEYFLDKAKDNSPLVKLLEEMGNKFSKGETAGGVARAVLAAPLAVAGFASGMAQLAGTGLAVVAVPSLPVMLWSGMSVGQLIGVCAAGFAIAGVGAVGEYLTDRCSHNVRRFFGDTKASWEQSLPDGKYPWKDPSSFM